MKNIKLGKKNKKNIIGFYAGNLKCAKKNA